MSDTIEGLRWRAREAAAKGDLISAEICDNAAGEIERLQRLVDHYEIVVKNHEEAHARFRAALKEIAEDDIDWWVTKKAKEALGDE